MAATCRGLRQCVSTVTLSEPKDPTSAEAMEVDDEHANESLPGPAEVCSVRHPLPLSLSVSLSLSLSLSLPVFSPPSLCPECLHARGTESLCAGCVSACMCLCVFVCVCVCVCVCSCSHLDMKFCIGQELSGLHNSSLSPTPFPLSLSLTYTHTRCD